MGLGIDDVSGAAGAASAISPWMPIIGAGMSLFGSSQADKAAKRAGAAQVQAGRESQNFIRQGVKDAKRDIRAYAPLADAILNQGFQGSLDVFGQALPQQAQAFQGGNVAAQNALLAGLPQQQAAILGGQLSPLNIQPYQQDYDMSWANQQLPSQAEILQGMPNPLAGQFQNNNDQMLADTYDNYDPNVNFLDMGLPALQPEAKQAYEAGARGEVLPANPAGKKLWGDSFNFGGF